MTRCSPAEWHRSGEDLGVEKAEATLRHRASSQPTWGFKQKVTRSGFILEGRSWGGEGCANYLQC